MTELTKERKKEIVADVEYAVNRYISKMDILHMAIEDVGQTEEELVYLYGLFFSFSVEDM